MQTDVLIIGCGIAGAAAALELARDSTRQVTLITRAYSALILNKSTPGLFSSSLVAAILSLFRPGCPGAG